MTVDGEKNGDLLLNLPKALTCEYNVEMKPDQGSL